MYITWRMKLLNALIAGIIPLVILVCAIMYAVYDFSTTATALAALAFIVVGLAWYYGYDRKPIRYKINNMQVIFKDRGGYVDPETLEREINKWVKFWRYSTKTRVKDGWRLLNEYKIVYSLQERPIPCDFVEKVIYIDCKDSRDWRRLQYLLGQIFVKSEGVSGADQQRKWREQRGLVYLEE